TQRVFTATSRSEPIALFRKVSFKDRFDHMHDRRLHNAVPNRGDSQGSSFRRAGFRDLHAPNGLRLIGSRLELVGQFPDRVWKLPFELAAGHMIHPRRAIIDGDLLKRSQQVPLRKHLVEQSKPRSSFRSRYESRQHARRPDARVGTPPYGVVLSSLLSRRHYRWWLFPTRCHLTSIFLRPFAPPALPGFI